MASIHRHPKSKFYHASYVDANGVRASKSTKQTKRGKAWRVAHSRKSKATSDA